MKRSRQQENALQAAIRHHEAGRFDRAEAIYRDMPSDPDAVNLRGVIAYQNGRFEDAATLIGKAIERMPSNAVFHYNFGLACIALGNRERAIAAYRKAAELDPRHADAINNLGVLLQEAGNLDDAIACYRKIVETRPDFVRVYGNLGAALRAQGDLSAAVAACRKGLELQPDDPVLLSNVGMFLRELGRLNEAIECLRRAIAIRPEFLDALNNLGGALEARGEVEEAISTYRRILEIRPDFAPALCNLGSPLLLLGRLDEAEYCFKRALAIDPTYAEGHNNLANVYLRQGRYDEAIASFGDALRINPDYEVASSNFLFTHNYHPTMSAEQIYSAYRHWNEALLSRIQYKNYPFANTSDPARRLRIGYLSPDFNNHTVMRFAGPMLDMRNRTQFEVVCYYNRTYFDQDTVRIVQSADRFEAIAGLTDDELAQRIRDDGIDILVDLAGHTGCNRLPVFARKPAPVQVSWLGFGYTTGLTAIDYFIGDPVFTPPGCEHLFSEAIWRLPHAAWSYQPPAEAPEPGPSPATARGHVTFAFTGRSERINDLMIEAWSRLLLRVPGSRLKIDSRNFADPTLCRLMEQRFARHGVSPERLELGFTSPVWDVYTSVDIVLDCFPHNSGTTTFEALWMGLPVVTLAARPSVGRLGASILACIGRPQWIATDVDDYVERAAALAQDLPALARERASLREAMRASPLLDRDGFVRDMEAAFRGMWQRWCASHSAIPVGDAASVLAAALEHHRAGRLEQAASLYRTLPDHPDAIHLLGVIALQQGRHAEAAEQFGRAIALQSDYPLAHNNLGNALRELGRLDEAVASYREALVLQPDYAEAHVNLGSALRKLGRLNEAIASYRAALASQPRLASAHYNLGNLLVEQGRLTEACDALHQAIAIDPSFYEAWNNIALALANLGRLDDAIACLEHVASQKPNHVEAHSNLLFCSNYHPDLSAENIFAAYRKWNARHATSVLPHSVSFDNVADPNRRLKIGYVSADFRNHSAIHFLGALLPHHDKSQVEVTCYANNTIHDAYTERVMVCADRWIPCSDLDDDHLAQRICEDNIDILIDLSGHTQGHRLLTFARKPAPVQVSWLGFGYTTGLTAIDYFIGDPVLTPPGCEHLFSEEIHRLPRCFAAFQPPETPEPSALPARTNGLVTFGCCSRGVRINKQVIEAWAAILHRMPGSCLRIDSGTFRDPRLCAEMAKHFATLGITPDRLDIRYTPRVWDVYNAIDIMLDCFPHNSGTTTYEALWMGVPVITLAGRPSVGRVGASILNAIGARQWIAASVDDYVDRAVSLASDIDALEKWRIRLRDAMLASPLLDHATFARDMESAYRKMWTQWCASRNPSKRMETAT